MKHLGGLDKTQETKVPAVSTACCAQQVAYAIQTCDEPPTDLFFRLVTLKFSKLLVLQITDFHFANERF